MRGTFWLGRGWDVVTWSVLVTLLQQVWSRCTVPSPLRGEYFSLHEGRENLNLDLGRGGLFDKNTNQEAYCVDWDTSANNVTDIPGANTRLLVRFRGWDPCFICYNIVYRNPNILQVRQSPCVTLEGGHEDALNRMCDYIDPDERLQTWFRKSPYTVNCNGTLHGNYSFTYERPPSPPCHSELNVLEACFNPLTDYTSNQVMWATFHRCSHTILPFDMLNVQLQCLGTWQDEKETKYAALLVKNETLYKHRFICMRIDDTDSLTLSTVAYCYFDSWHPKVHLSLTSREKCPEYNHPTCEMPKELFGQYYLHHGKADTSVVIHSGGMVLGEGQNSVCYMRGPGTGNDVLGSPGVMYSQKVIVRWDDPLKKYHEKYKCFHLVQRTPNVIQYKESSVLRAYKYSQDKPGFDSMCSHNMLHHLVTLFRFSPSPQLCSQAQLMANYKFSYSVPGDNITKCKSSVNRFTACTGSEQSDFHLEGTYSINFNMSFGDCQKNSTEPRELYSFLCLGSWDDGQGNSITALYDPSQTQRKHGYRCLLTGKGAIQPSHTGIPFVLSASSKCRENINPYEGPIQLQMYKEESCEKTTTITPLSRTTKSPQDQGELEGDYWEARSQSSHQCRTCHPLSSMLAFCTVHLVCCLNHNVLPHS